jgi:hypothetical protein
VHSSPWRHHRWVSGTGLHIRRLHDLRQQALPACRKPRGRLHWQQRAEPGKGKAVSLMTAISKTVATYKQHRAYERERDEKAAIAKAFNDRYCYRVRHDAADKTVIGTGIFGGNFVGGFRWMCPECNKIHAPKKLSMFTGLQYPACCSTHEGDRLGANIRTM